MHVCKSARLFYSFCVTQRAYMSVSNIIGKRNDGFSKNFPSRSTMEQNILEDFEVECFTPA